MTIATETLTVRLPIHAVNRLRHVASLVQRPLDQIIADTLQSTLPPILDDIPVRFHAELQLLEGWSNDALKQQVFARLNFDGLGDDEAQIIENFDGVLTAKERQEADRVRHQSDLLMFRKAYAALILKWRGQRVPTLSELEAAE